MRRTDVKIVRYGLIRTHCRAFTAY